MRALPVWSANRFLWDCWTTQQWPEVHVLHRNLLTIHHPKLTGHQVDFQSLPSASTRRSLSGYRDNNPAGGESRRISTGGFCD
ncbi:hypothetical protein P4S72_03810 [Vibrio sp. PP-XX7]